MTEGFLLYTYLQTLRKCHRAGTVRASRIAGCLSMTFLQRHFRNSDAFSQNSFMSQWPICDPVIEKEKEWTLGSDRAGLNPSCHVPSPWLQVSHSILEALNRNQTLRFRNNVFTKYQYIVWQVANIIVAIFTIIIILSHNPFLQRACHPVERDLCN